MGEGIQNWTATHGAEWVTNISDDQREAITSMIDRATTGAWTGDELARAIRPLIGLTKPQALANLNYYEHLKATLLANNPTMKEATAAKAARDAAAKYAAKQHRQRAYTTEELTGWLRAAGFNDIRTWGDGKLRRPTENEQRIYFSCIRE